MKKLTCLCCGAPINRAKQKCEYCGTEYIIQDETLTINVESFTNPVREFAVCRIIPKEEVAYFGETSLEKNIHRLAEAMLPAVMEGMRIEAEPDFNTGGQRLTGRIRMVIPEHGVGEYRR